MADKRAFPGRKYWEAKNLKVAASICAQLRNYSRKIGEWGFHKVLCQALLVKSQIALGVGVNKLPNEFFLWVNERLNGRTTEEEFREFVTDMQSELEKRTAALTFPSIG